MPATGATAGGSPTGQLSTQLSGPQKDGKQESGRLGEDSGKQWSVMAFKIRMGAMNFHKTSTNWRMNIYSLGFSKLVRSIFFWKSMQGRNKGQGEWGVALCNLKYNNIEWKAHGIRCYRESCQTQAPLLINLEQVISSIVIEHNDINLSALFEGYIKYCPKNVWHNTGILTNIKLPAEN